MKVYEILIPTLIIGSLAILNSCAVPDKDAISKVEKLSKEVESSENQSILAGRQYKEAKARHDEAFQELKNQEIKFAMFRSYKRTGELLSEAEVLYNKALEETPLISAASANTTAVNSSNGVKTYIEYELGGIVIRTYVDQKVTIEDGVVSWAKDNKIYRVKGNFFLTEEVYSK